MAGVGVTMFVQSSTATALIVTSFVARGFMETAPALAIMLGADIATALVAQILSFNFTLLSPILILTGVIMHKALSQNTHRQIGRAAIGLGLMLLALSIIVGTLTPLRSSQVIQTLFTALAHDPLIALVLAALLTWLAHSSLAAVLLVMSFVSTGIMSIGACSGDGTWRQFGGRYYTDHGYHEPGAHWPTASPLAMPPLNLLACFFACL